MAEPIGDFRAAILATLGHAPETIEPGRFIRFATRERRGDSAGWCKLFDDMRGGVYGCKRQGISETWSAINPTNMTRLQRGELARQVMKATAAREAEQRSQWAANAKRIAKALTECVPVSAGDPVAKYLRRRGVGGVWPEVLPEVLRLHRELPYWHGAEKLGTFPAMVAPIVAPDGRIVALHKTYLTNDGRKAGVPSPKKMSSTAGSLAGACIPLHKPVRGVLGVAEGIETALAASCASGLPTLATYCAGALAGFVWPCGVQRLVIFADNDKAGREAADKLRARAVASRLRCEVLTPTTEGADWCDVWAARDAVLIEAGGAA